MTSTHVSKFWSCFPKPPDQPAVGDSPQDYLRKLNQLCGSKLVWPANHPKGPLNRAQLCELCRDTNVGLLVAYAAVMAWGGRGVDSRNYRLSLSEESRKNLVEVLTKLRGSMASRQDDFAAMQSAAENIKGLGISFYTKLLFFFRGKADAYILDQFTAKSANLLFFPCHVVLNSSNYPDANNTPASYEWFCAAVETMGSSQTTPRPWTGEEVEQAMFDIRGGSWRTYVRGQFNKSPSCSRKSLRANLSVPSAPSGSSCCHKLAYEIAKAHGETLDSGELELPGTLASLPASTPVRVNCGSLNGINWQYDVQKGSVHAMVFIAKQHRARYDALRKSLGILDHDFGDGVIGTGFKDSKTCAIKCTIPRGANAPQTEWTEIAREAVNAMNRLFLCIGESI